MLVKEQAEAYLASLAARKRHPVKANSIRSIRCHLRAHVLPFFGEMEVSCVRNGELKNFVNHLVSLDLAPNTISANLAVIKAVIASATDTEGNRLYPVVWNPEFIDAPVIQDGEENAPIVPRETLQEAILGGYEAFQPLYALLAGSGLRVAEAIALRQGLDDGQTSFWDRGGGVIHVRTQIQGTAETSPKTAAGERQIDLDPRLNAYLCRMIPERTGRMFSNRAGGFLVTATIYKYMHRDGIPGFHSCRRFRLTHLRAVGVPEDLIQLWMGHARKSVTDRYSRLAQDIEFRKTWAAKAGLGFQLTEASCSH